MSRREALSRGFSMMDQGDYQSAIEYFAKLAVRDPHYHVKMAWASAYAGRAGIKIEQIYNFVVVKNAVPEHSPRGDFQKIFSQYLDHWRRVPVVSEKFREDLVSALRILQEENTPGARLYAATLRVVLLKTSIVEGLQKWNFDDSQKICERDWRPFFEWSLRIMDGVLALVRDLEMAFPGTKDYQEVRVRLLAAKKEAEALPWPREDVCL